MSAGEGELPRVDGPNRRARGGADDAAPADPAAGEPWWRDGIRFGCTACGKCCRNHGQDGEYAHVYSTRSERRALAAHFGLSLRAFERQYLERHAGGVRSFKTVDDGCVFLDEKGQCSVYELRPSQCRTFPFWADVLADQDTWERDVASFCPGVGEGPLHDAEEIARRMEEAG